MDGSPGRPSFALRFALKQSVCLTVQSRKPPTLNIRLWNEIMGRLRRGAIGSESHICR